jgi:Arc/MetJ-type ribon-helix-helix transcriptional regulator
MPQASDLQVTLPQESIDFIQSKVASGEFSSESEVILEGIAELRDKDLAFERWAREVAVPAYERLLADPSRGIPLDRVRANFAARLHGTRD